jgi:hypothetical protein
MIYHLYPDADLFGADALKHRVTKNFCIKKAQLIEILRSGQTSEVSTTTDIWTSPADVPFMTVTASFILDNGIIFLNFFIYL